MEISLRAREESAWFKRCDEFYGEGNARLRMSRLLYPRRAVAILQFISVSVPGAAQTPAVIIPSLGRGSSDGHIKFLIKRWIDRNKWKDAGLWTCRAPSPGEKSVSAFQYSQVAQRSLLPANYASSGFFSSPCHYIRGNQRKEEGERFVRVEGQKQFVRLNWFFRIY